MAGMAGGEDGPLEKGETGAGPGPAREQEPGLEDPSSILEQIARATAVPPYEGRLYAVGGFLRDLRLGRWNGAEIDMVLEGNALDLAEFLHRTGVAAAPVTYRRFGTAMTRVRGLTIELVTARRESYEESSRKPFVEPATVHEDALRRDFTINTLLRNLHTGAWLDPTGSAFEDLARGVLRTPLDPDQTFFDDPLRMLRAVRFACQLGFQIDPPAVESIRRNSHRLQVISQERIRDEWNKLLMSPRPALGLQLLHDLGLLPRVLPAASALPDRPAVQDGSPDNPVSLWEHTLSLLDSLPAATPLNVRLASVIHHGCSPAQARQALGDLRYSKTETDGVALLLEVRARIIAPPLLPTSRGSEAGFSAAPVPSEASAEDPLDLWSAGDIRRLIRYAGALLGTTLQWCALDRLVGDPDLVPCNLDRLRQQVEELESIAPSASLESPLDGSKLIEVLGIPPGPIIREAKEWLLNEVLDGRLVTGDRLSARQQVIGRFGPAGC